MRGSFLTRDSAVILLKIKWYHYQKYKDYMQDTADAAQIEGKLKENTAINANPSTDFNNGLKRFKIHFRSFVLNFSLHILI